MPRLMNLDPGMDHFLSKKYFQMLIPQVVHNRVPVHTNTTISLPEECELSFQTMQKGGVPVQHTFETNQMRNVMHERPERGLQAKGKPLFVASYI